MKHQLRTEKSAIFRGDSPQLISRRRFGSLASGLLGSVIANACRLESVAAPADQGRLTARPVAGTKTSRQGTSALGLDQKRDAILQLPEEISPDPLPLLVLFHGAGGSGSRLLNRFASVARAAGVAVVAPDSREGTWDAIRGDFGGDVVFVNRVLERVFQTVAVDPARIAAGGFSDGATYAISLGLINGDLFERVVAFSPGFVVDGPPHGRPRFFVSHGTADPILPIERCSRMIVQGLRRRGYDVTYREFAGGHEVPAAIADEGVRWAAEK